MLLTSHLKLPGTGLHGPFVPISLAVNALRGEKSWGKKFVSQDALMSAWQNSKSLVSSVTEHSEKGHYYYSEL